MRARLARAAGFLRRNRLAWRAALLAGYLAGSAHPDALVVVSLAARLAHARERVAARHRTPLRATSLASLSLIALKGVPA
jgi:hypothetical protein